MIYSGQILTKIFFTYNGFGQSVDADSTPTGTLVVSGVDNGATVTVTKLSTGRYKATVTLPALTTGDVVDLAVTATVGGVARSAVVFTDVAGSKDGYSLTEAYDAAKTAGTATNLAAVKTVVDAVKAKTDALPADPASNTQVNTRLAAASYATPPTAGDIASAVWGAGTRTLTSFGSLVADVVSGVWGAGVRTLSAFGFSVTASSVTDKTGYTLHSDYDAAKTAAQAGDEMGLTEGAVTAVQAGIAKTSELPDLTDAEAALIKIQAAVYDSATADEETGEIELSNGATQTVTETGRVTSE